MNTINQEVKKHFEQAYQFESDFKFQEALLEYQMVIDNDNSMWAHYGKGLMLIRLYRFGEAIEVCENIIKNNVNSLPIQLSIIVQFIIIVSLFMQGKYKESKEKGEEVIDEFEKLDKSQIGKVNTIYNIIGSIYQMLGDLQQAEENYKREVELYPDDTRPLTNLMKLHIYKKEENIEEQTDEYWKVRDSYIKAKKIIETKPNYEDDINNLTQLAQLYSAVEEYDKAEQYLFKIIGKGEIYVNTDTYILLGYIYTQQKKYKQARKYFLKAHKLDESSLIIRANIARTYFDSDEIEEAEKEYHKILQVTQYNIEAHIGLGETYLHMADNGEKDLYKEAISYFDKAIELTKQEKIASRALKKKEKASVYYLRGYAKVKLHECLKIKSIQEELLLYDAKKDFQACLILDPGYHKAKRAIEKIDKKLIYLYPPRLGSVLIAVLAIFTFWAGFSSFGLNTIDIKYSILLLFGGMLFLTIGISLPQLLKLKVGNIELEKSSVDQITTSIPIDIRR